MNKGFSRSVGIHDWPLILDALSRCDMPASAIMGLVDEAVFPGIESDYSWAKPGVPSSWSAFKV